MVNFYYIYGFIAFQLSDTKKSPPLPWGVGDW